MVLFDVVLMVQHGESNLADLVIANVMIIKSLPRINCPALIFDAL